METALRENKLFVYVVRDTQAYADICLAERGNLFEICVRVRRRNARHF